jgi:excisionase family DNA binding protein
MPFDVYFPISEVAARLGTSRMTVKRWAQRGELGPVYRLARELTVGQAGLLAFLERNREDFTDDQARALRREALERKLGRIVPAERGPFSPGVSARCAGELRRKMATVQTSEHEEESA